LNIEMEQRIETMSWVVKKFEQESAHVQLPFKQLSFNESKDLNEIEKIKANLKKSLEIFLVNTNPGYAF
jgi:hypothetical protein